VDPCVIKLCHPKLENVSLPRVTRKDRVRLFSAEIYLILKDDRCGTDEILILRSNLRDGQQSEDIKNLRLIK
jgi:hypothetical protein